MLVSSQSLQPRLTLFESSFGTVDLPWSKFVGRRATRVRVPRLDALPPELYHARRISFRLGVEGVYKEAYVCQVHAAGWLRVSGSLTTKPEDCVWVHVSVLKYLKILETRNPDRP